MARFERRGFGGRSSSFHERVDIPKPVKVGEEYDVEINEVGSKGDGIARVKNFVVFVADVKKGEKAHIKIKEVRNRFAIGENMKKGHKKEGKESKKGKTEESEESTEEMKEERETEAEDVTEQEVSEAGESETQEEAY